MAGVRGATLGETTTFAGISTAFFSTLSLRVSVVSKKLPHRCPTPTIDPKTSLSNMEVTMGFSGIRAVILIAVLLALIVAVTKFDFPGWFVPVGLLATAAILKGAEQRASS